MIIRVETRDGSNSLGEIDLRPTKAICVGRNYGAHAAELGHDVPVEPLIFMKPASSIILAGQAIERPDGFERVDHEGELAIVISKRASNISEENAHAYILGYTCANDITVRDLQGKGPWLRAKGMDSFLPIGPRIVSDLDPASVNIAVRVNGETKQEGNTSQFIFPIARVLAFITSQITLEEHDLVLTGTPAGVGNLAVGDQVEVDIEGIGVLKNPVVRRGH